MGAVASTNIITDGLIACWDAGNRRSYPGAGTTWTDLVLQNAGSMSPSPTFASYKAGVMSFDGTDDVVTISSSTELSALTTGDFSFEAWVNVVDADDAPNKYVGVIVLVDVGLVLMGHTYPEGEAGVGILWPVTGNNWAGEFTSATIKYGEWAYIGCTRTGTTYNTYINGVNYTTSTDDGNWAMTDWKIGKGYSSHFFYGDMGVIRVYNRVLTDAEVKQNYEATKPRFTPRITKSGLVASWDAGDPQSYTSGDIWKDTANSANGELENDTSFSAAGGGSFAFDGTDDYVNIPYNSALDVTSVSILAWIKIDSSHSDAHDVFRKNYDTSGSNSHSYGIQTNSAGVMFFNIRVASGTSGLNSGETLSDDTWTFIAGTYDGTTMRTYKDDSVGDTSTSVSGDLVSSADIALIGASKRSSNTEMKGNIASVRIYNRALSAAEVMDNYNKTKGRFGH